MPNPMIYGREHIIIRVRCEIQIENIRFLRVSGHKRFDIKEFDVIEFNVYICAFV